MNATRLIVLFVPALALAACDAGYRGRLVDEDGRALGGWDWRAELFCTNVVYGQGSSYLERDEYSDHGQTAGDGAFAIGVPSDVCEGTPLSISFSNFPDGRSLGLTVPAPRPSLMLPDLPVWSPEVEVTEVASGKSIRWTEVPLLAEGAEYYPQAGSVLTLGDDPVLGTELTIDGRLLQDWTLPVTMLARASHPDFNIHWVATGLATLQGDAAPLSRGAACSAIGEGIRVDFAPGECPVTSGSIDDAIDVSIVEPGIDEIVVDLGAVTSFGSVTLHRAFGGGDFGDLPYLNSQGGTPATGTVDVEGSDDCVSFSPIAAVSPAGAITKDPIAAAGSGRCVKLRFGGELSLLAEVGVW